jgi:hypothetical protein
MLSVVNIMSVYHALKIFASFFGTPPEPLMDDYIVKDKIKSSVTEYTDGNRQHIRVVGDLREIIEEKDRRNAENSGKKIIALQRMVVHGVMGFMPAP